MYVSSGVLLLNEPCHRSASCHAFAAGVGREALHECYPCMSATHVGNMKVQGLDVSHVYYVEGFKKNLLLTVALRKHYALVQVDDAMHAVETQTSKTFLL